MASNIQIIDKTLKLFKKVPQPFHKHIRIIVTRYGIDSNNFLVFKSKYFFTISNKNF